MLDDGGDGQVEGLEGKGMGKHTSVSRSMFGLCVFVQSYQR